MLIYELYPKSDVLIPILLPHIYKQKKDNPDMTLGVSGGLTWSGYKTKWEWCSQLYDLFEYIENRYSKIIGHGPFNYDIWGNIMSSGGILNNHDHNDGINKWTGVYYLTSATINIMSTSLSFEPGWFILFPASEMHGVSKVDKERVSLAFNIW
jgi:hypothetical protein